MRINSVFIILMFSNLFSMEIGLEEYATINSPDSLFNIVSRSNGLKNVLKNIVKKSPEERKNHLDNFPEPIIQALKNLAG